MFKLRKGFGDCHYPAFNGNPPMNVRRKALFHKPFTLTSFLLCKGVVDSLMASSMSIQGAYETASCVVKPNINRNNAALNKEAASQGQSLKELK